MWGGGQLGALWVGAVRGGWSRLWEWLWVWLWVVAVVGVC